MPDLRALFRRAHKIARALTRPGLSYAANLSLALRKLWSDARRTLKPITGRTRRLIEKATVVREVFFDKLFRDLEDIVHQSVERPGVWVAAQRIFSKLVATTDAKFWIEIQRHGLFALDYVGEIVAKDRELNYDRTDWLRN